MAPPATVLIADNDEANVQLLTDICNGEGLAVQVARDGEETIASVRSAPPDLILLDVMMPLMDGFEVLETLRTDDTTRELPVILVTAVADDDSIRRGYELGANDYITKPFKVAELVARMQSLVRASAYMKSHDEQRWWQVGKRPALESKLAAALEAGSDWSLVLFRVIEPKATGEAGEADSTPKLIEAAAQSLRRLVRGVDSAFVIDESIIALLLPDTPLRGAKTVAHHLAEKVETSIPIDGRPMTMTLAWTVTTSDERSDPHDIIHNGVARLTANPPR
jgi:CheY-like chemotaxis protein/GGDEF domain-containing protein